MIQASWASRKYLRENIFPGFDLPRFGSVWFGLARRTYEFRFFGECTASVLGTGPVQPQAKNRRKQERTDRGKSETRDASGFMRFGFFEFIFALTMYGATEPVTWCTGETASRIWAEPGDGATSGSGSRRVGLVGGAAAYYWLRACPAFSSNVAPECWIPHEHVGLMLWLAELCISTATGPKGNLIPTW